MKINKGLISILFLFTGLTLSAQCNVSAAEKQALIDLYNATNGPNWTNTWDIVNDEPCDWYGVTVSGSNVETLDLANNGLNGILPNIWPTLGQLTFLNISGVDIENFESNSAPYTLVFENVQFTNNIEFDSFSGTVSFQNNVGFNVGSQLSNNGFIAINNSFVFNGSLQNNGTIQGDFLINGSASIDNSGTIENIINQGTLSLNNQFGNITSINNTGSMDVGSFGAINELKSTTGDITFDAFTVVDANDRFEVVNSTLNTLPDFDGETLTLFDITNSYLGFQSLESQFSTLQQNASTFNYTPLRTTISGNNELDSGETLTLSVNVSGNNNHYAWFKDDVLISSAPDSNTFSLPNIAVADAGAYRCEITNDIVTGGLIQSDVINVTVTPDPCGVSATEKQALIDLYNATDGPNWTNTWDIVNDEPCDWYGITVTNGEILNINLRNNNLTGTIPASIGDITSLEFLQLDSNNLSGSIPASIGNLVNLIQLRLHVNSFTGNIPSTLGNLGSLTLFLANDNNLSGQIPSTLGNLTNLNSLLLFNNDLSGSIPIEFGNLNSLSRLQLSQNQLSGNIPSAIASLSFLDYLQFANNQYVFSDFESEHTTYLNVTSNYSFSPQAKVDQEESLSVLENGTITLTSTALTSPNNSYQWFKRDTNGIGQPIAGATSKDYVISDATTDDAGVYYFEATNSIVTGLTLTRNDITINVDPNPCGVSAAEKQALIDFYNATNGDNWTTSWDIVNTEPCDWTGVTVIDGEVRELLLTANGLNGTLPASIGDLIHLRRFFLLSNINLTGTIPVEVGNMASLEEFSIVLSNVSGGIPTSFGSLTNLNTIRLEKNQLSGTLPIELTTLPALSTLALFENNFTGSIPLEYGNFPVITNLRLDQNQLSGLIPTSLGNLTTVERLNLQVNQLEGTVPIELGNLPNLIELRLNGNNLSGDFPLLANNPTLNYFNYQENLFVFSNLETSHPTYESNVNIYIYSPQAKVDQEESLSVLENGTITLTSTALTSPNNSYQWFKRDTNGIGQPIVGATSKDYVISDATTDDAGVYYFEATNSIVTGLTLTRNDITLTVEADSCGVSAAERQALLDLYNSTNGDNWVNTLAGDQPWDPAIPVCDWFGVTVVNGNVTILLLPNNQLSGSIPSSINQLTNLNELYLYSNQLVGTIPSEMGELTNLTQLSLYNNQLTGSIPSELGQLSSLANFLLNNNNLNGVIPSELGQLNQLTNLSLNFNQLSGTIPSQLGLLTNLNFLFLEGNELSGDIPIELGNLVNLDQLHLNSNQLTGNIPLELGQLNGVSRIQLGNNLLTGTIPTELGQLSGLRNLELQNNGLVGTIPTELGQLSNLFLLYLENNQLSGNIPDFTGIASLNRFTIEGNGFVFSDFEQEHSSYSDFDIYRFVPQAKVDQEESLSVLENGTITLTSTALTSPNNSYQWFKRDANGIGQPIAGATSKDYVISDATTDDAGVYYFEATNSIVTGLTLTRNDITLTVEADSCGVSATERQALLDLYNSTNGDNWVNTLAGDQPWDPAIPVCDWFGVTVVNGNVTELYLASNNLVGTLPASVGDLSNLTSIYIRNNSSGNLSGPLPSEFGNLTALTSIDFQGNDLSGTLPPEFCNLTNLTFLNLFSNDFAGQIPSCITTFSDLEQLYLGFNSFSGELPQDIGVLGNLTRIDVSRNDLSGNIPASIANLSQLQILMLYSNEFTGEVPEAIGDLSNTLNFVRFHDNLLEGRIPPGFADLEGSNVTFSIYNNFFHFEDFEQEHPIHLSRVRQEYTFAPQKKVDDVESLNVLENGSITLTSTDLFSSNNSYQWFKRDTNGIGQPIAGATSKDYVISDATTDDAGVYYFEATNSIVTGLTLTRNDITLTVDEDSCGVSAAERQALLDLYNSTNGDSWTNTLSGNQPWDPAIPVCDWFGVIVANNEVTSVALNNNNLVGNIPASIEDLVHLRSFTLSDNQLSGPIQPVLGNLAQLQILFLNGNDFSGSIPVELANLTNLLDLILYENNLTGTIPPELSTLPNLRDINLLRNNITGSIPPEFGNFSANLFRINVGDNQLSGTIPGSVSTLPGLTQFLFQTNEFVFADFELEHTAYENNLTIYGFSPQAKVDLEESLEVTNGGTITLTSTDLTSPNNSYQWFKRDTNGIGQPIAGATSKDYVITDATTDDAGVYYFEATNSVVVGLTLTRNDITLTLGTGPATVVQEFCTMNGLPTLNDFSGGTINGFPPDWYLTETGGTPIPGTTLLEENVTYWFDDTQDGSDIRVPHEAIIDDNIPTGDTDQSFDFATNPTLTDVVVQGAGGTNVIWFDSVDGTTPLPSTTPLVDGETYYALSDITDAECRLGITVSDDGPTEVCEEVLVQSGSGGGSVIDGSFELASNVIIPNNRNEDMGNSGWGPTQGTPDTFATPYNNSNDPELLDSFISSPNGGICAGGQRIGNQTEAFAANISGLSTSTTYVVEFYQANVSNVLADEISKDTNGFWEVSFGGVSRTSSSIAPSISGNTNWRKQSLEFNVSSTTQLLQFTVSSSAQDQNNAYAVYMLIDGIRVYEKPVDIYTTVCYDLFTQVFCNYDDENEPTIGDLEAPNGGTVTWHSNRTGGERYFSNELLVDLPSFIVWADDGVNDRVAVEILFDFGAPFGDTYQFFDLNSNPTLADMVVEGTNITWHSSFESETTLPLSTPLIDDTIYYAAQEGNECRLSVQVELGVPNPLGSQYQEFCSTTNPTIADLVVETTSPGYTVQWYSAETGGTIYNSTDALEDGQTYYAEQTDGVNASESRIPFVVSVIDVTVAIQIQDLDIEVPNNSTVQTLTDFFSLSPGILWYNDPYEGTAYSAGAQLFDGETYYGRLNTGGICETSEVLAVTVSIADVVEPELITCIKFIPQPGRHYVIGAWAREQPVEAEPAGTSSFDEVKDSFLELLDYLASKIRNKEEIPSVLVLREDANAPNVDNLLPYVKNTADKNLTVYDFAFEKETVGGVEKSVGFSFSLAPGNTERFVYLTPTVALTFDVFGVNLGDFGLGYRFPIRNYDGLEIEFTDVAVVAGKFRITSNFTVVDDTSTFLKKEYTNETVDSTTDSGIEDVIQLFNYVEIPGTQPTSYDLTSVELSYKDASGADLPDLDGISEVVFEPKGAVIDGWQRIAGDFTIPTDAVYMKITLRNRGSDLNAYFDDVRIVPFDGNMKSFVYDPITQRLMAELDENNYATFYEYDTEGGLVRVKKETERGVYTIQETRSGNSKLNAGE